jgi:hypothetical protein
MMIICGPACLEGRFLSNIDKSKLAGTSNTAGTSIFGGESNFAGMSDTADTDTTILGVDRELPQPPDGTLVPSKIGTLMGSIPAC